MIVGRHRLPLEAFDQLAQGNGDVETVRLLRDAQLSKRILMLRAVAESAAAAAPEVFAKSEAAASLRIVAAAHAASRDAVNDLLLTPDVGIWTAAALRLLQPPRPEPVPDDLLGFLGPVAIAATLFTDLVATVTVHATAGSFMVPMFGLVTVETATEWLTVRVSGRDRSLIVSDPASGERVDDDETVVVVVTPDHDGPRFSPLRHLSTTHGDVHFNVVLDDVGLSRAQLELPFATRLSAPQIDLWQRQLDEGWRELTLVDPDSASSIASGVTTLFPLSSDLESEQSASTSDAFGAVATTLPRDGTACAATLVHESQHGKLSALLDLVPLFDETDETLHYAPWRADPRPLAGLLQGAYAYLGLVGFWDRRRQRPDSGLYAHFEFARWREEVWLALGTLRSHGRATPLGQRFLDVMTTTADRYRQAAVPSAAREPALAVAAECWSSWQLRNCAPPEASVVAWAAAWATSRKPPRTSPLHCSVRPGERQVTESNRMTLTRLQLRDPARFRAAVAGMEEHEPSADRLYVGGAVGDAASRYKTRILDDPADIDAWLGLVVCRRAERGTTSMLVREPAAVRAVYAHAASAHGKVADPDALADWMS